MNKTDYLVAKGRIPDPNLGTMWIIKSTRVSVVMFELPIWEIREGCFRNTYNPETKEKKEVEFTTYFFKDDPFDISIDVDDKHEQFGFAVNLFRDKYEDALTKVFKSKDYRNSQAFVCFALLSLLVRNHHSVSMTSSMINLTLFCLTSQNTSMA
jgi:hypothetical protein